MGELKTKKSEIGSFLRIDIPDDENLLDQELVFQGLGCVKVSIVKLGEPHVVVFVEDVERENIFSYGHAISQNRKLFPYGINVDLVQIIGKSSIRLRTYERGVWDETMACGTGATAAGAVSYVTGRVKCSRIKAVTRGGELIVEIGENSLYLVGPAAKVYSGLITYELE